MECVYCFHYPCESGESCSEIKADANVTIMKVHIKDSDRYATILFIVFEIGAIMHWNKDMK